MAADIELRNIVDAFIKKTRASIFGLASIIEKNLGLFSTVDSYTEITSGDFTAVKFIFINRDYNGASVIVVPGDLGISPADNVNQFEDSKGNKFVIFQPGQIKA